MTLGYLITAEEIDALHGVPHAAQLVYLRELRPRMDYATGVVGGGRRRISWQGIAEAIEVNPHQGVRAERYNKNQCKRLIGWLSRIGLVESIGDGDHLVFRLPMAAADYSDQNKADPIPTPSRPPKADPIPTPQNQASMRVSAGDGDESRPPPNSAETEKADPHPVSGKEEDKKVVNNLVELTLDSSPVAAIFAHWQQVMGKPRSRLDDKRRKAIAARLKEGYTADQLKRAIEGNKASPWHQGQNDRRTCYDDIELICRNASKVDHFIALAHQQSANQRAIDDFVHGNDQNIIEGEYTHVAR
jgi:hypothetical protein